MAIPAPIANAVRNASAPFDNPDNKCPAIKSRTALVMDKPGTRGITDPIIILSICVPSPEATRRADKSPITNEAVNSAKKANRNKTVEIHHG